MYPWQSRHPYAAFLAQVQKPSRYTGGEYGEKRPDPGARARVCLAFPDAYEIGMSHLGTKILYNLLGKSDGVACERVFAPWPDLERELRARSLPGRHTSEEAPSLPVSGDVVSVGALQDLVTCLRQSREVGAALGRRPLPQSEHTSIVERGQIAADDALIGVAEVS